MTGIMCAIAGGGGGDTNISLVNGNVSSSGSGVRTATFRLGSDGTAYHGDNGSFSASYTWCNDPGDPTDYEVRATLQDGSLSAGTSGSWLSLASNRDWAVQDTVADGPSTAELLLEIRNATTLVVLDSATVNLSAERLT